MGEKEKLDNAWYDDLVVMYQKTKIPELRNVLWEQVKLLIYSLVRRFINEKKSSILKRDSELCKKLYDDAFFIFCKCCDSYDPSKKTKFLTFLGYKVPQDIRNTISLHYYHKNRDQQIEKKVEDEMSVKESHEIHDVAENFESEVLLDEIRILFENFSFETPLERDVIYTLMYGKSGDWKKLQKKSKLTPVEFNRFRSRVVEKLRKHIVDSCSPKMRDVLQEWLHEK